MQDDKHSKYDQDFFNEILDDENSKKARDLFDDKGAEFISSIIIE
ncbi:UNVERIFIED_CONTAM: hypothetical protein O8I53_11345 [Campylobacter lari]